MFAYEIQPKDHAGDFEIRERRINGVKLQRHRTESGEPCIVMEVSFGDNHSDGWELEFSIAEWEQLLESVSPPQRKD
jgi:hypothetical protein